MSEPTTAAGRALIGSILLALQQEGADVADLSWVDQVADVEAEARQQDGAALPKHQPRWEQSRDEDVGMWRCACGDRTFAPDDFGGYFEHLRAALPPSAPAALDVERLGIALTNLTSRGDDSWMQRAIAERGNWEWSDWAEQIAAEYARLQEQDR